jgi:DNA-binding MarR family transcriptional regulator
VDVRWLDAEELRAWRALLGAHARLVRALDAELQAQQGTTLADHEVLIVLSELGGSCRMADLADALALSRSGLTRRIDRMAKAGLVAREVCPTDRRGIVAVLTDAGRAELERATPTHVRGVREHFVDPLAPDELRVIADALAKVATSVAHPLDEVDGACGQPEEAAAGRLGA